VIDCRLGGRKLVQHAILRFRSWKMTTSSMTSYFWHRPVHVSFLLFGACNDEVFCPSAGSRVITTNTTQEEEMRMCILETTILFVGNSILLLSSLFRSRSSRLCLVSPSFSPLLYDTTRHFLFPLLVFLLPLPLPRFPFSTA